MRVMQSVQVVLNLYWGCANHSNCMHSSSVSYPPPVLPTVEHLVNKQYREFEQLKRDQDGNVWFGVDKGARRYDGKSWTDYTSADGL